MQAVQSVAVGGRRSSTRGVLPLGFGRDVKRQRRRCPQLAEETCGGDVCARVGPIDIVATRYGVEVQNATCIALTKLDCLSYMNRIPVCVRYLWIIEQKV